MSGANEDGVLCIRHRAAVAEQPRHDCGHVSSAEQLFIHRVMLWLIRVLLSNSFQSRYPLLTAAACAGKGCELLSTVTSSP